MAEKNHKFASNEPEGELPKYSNLFAFKYIYKYDPFVVTGKLGVDVGNKSVFKSLKIFLGKSFSLGDRILLKLYTQKYASSFIHLRIDLKLL